MSYRVLMPFLCVCMFAARIFHRAPRTTDDQSRRRKDQPSESSPRLVLLSLAYSALATTATATMEAAAARATRALFPPRHISCSFVRTCVIHNWLISLLAFIVLPAPSIPFFGFFGFFGFCFFFPRAAQRPIVHATNGCIYGEGNGDGGAQCLWREGGAICCWHVHHTHALPRRQPANCAGSSQTKPNSDRRRQVRSHSNFTEWSGGAVR